MMLQKGQNEKQERHNKKQYGKNVTQKLHEVEASPQTFMKEFLEFQKLSPQPSWSSHYKFIEGGKIIPQTFAVPLFYELEEKRGRTHRWMQIAKSKKVQDAGLMEENVPEMRK